MNESRGAEGEEAGHTPSCQRFHLLRTVWYLCECSEQIRYVSDTYKRSYSN